jgi:hypothetical protein
MTYVACHALLRRLSRSNSGRQAHVSGSIHRRPIELSSGANRTACEGGAMSDDCHTVLQVPRSITTLTAGGNIGTFA